MLFTGKVAYMLRAVLVAVALAVLAMPALGRAQVTAGRVQRLVEALADPSYKVRLEAALALAHLKDRRAVPALIRALQDPHPLVRGMSAHALGLLGDSRAVPPLRDRLKDRDDLVRRRAKLSLDQLLRPSAQRATILVRLGGMGDKTKRGKNLVPQLRRLWREQITGTPGLQLLAPGGGGPGQKIYEVTASIVELSSHQRGDTVETTCNISVVLGDQKGSIVMMTSGGATVQVESRRFDRSREPAMQTSALEGAIASAHSNLMKYLARR